MKDFTNRELFNGIMGHNIDALKYLYNHFFSKVYKSISKYGATESDANDVFQESIILFFRKAKEGEIDHTTVILPYIMQSCKIIWYNIYHRKKLESNQLPENLAEEIQVYNEFLLSKRKALYYKHFETLEATCKSVLIAFFEEKSYKTIAEEMGFKDEAYARKKKQICKNYLVKKIKEDPDYKNLFYDDEGFF